MYTSLQIRPYSSNDFSGCIELFKSNQPKYFSEEELSEFGEFLKLLTDKDDYFVLEDKNRLIGCGGIFFEEDIAGLSWGMIHSDYHRQGLGKLLTEFRLEKIKEKYPTFPIRLVTCQHTVGFYENLGFEKIAFTKDGFSKGLDRYDMRKVES